ncbi:His-Xaa-Ser system protein HxsD, partial [Candidatus Neomarinimicrobiota bacterium]
MSDNHQNMEISLALYSKEAVLNATYKFTDKFYIRTELISESRISVNFTAKDKSTVTEGTINEFNNELIDQQLRINTEKEYKTIREEIVKKAFNPISEMK